MLPYTESGTGDRVLIFLHFFGSSQREWSKVIAQLSPNHRCIAADMPGFATAADLPGYTVAEMAAHIDALVRSFAPSPVVLIPHSFSGKVSMVVAADAPDNLQRLILVAPSPLVPEPMTADARETMAIANTTDERIAKFVHGGSYTTLSKEAFATAADDVKQANAEAWLAWPRSGSREDWSTRILSLNVPTDLVVGEHDPSIPLDFQIEHTLPMVQDTGGRIHVIPNAAHLLPYEAAPQLGAILEQILSA